jgi:hypothetical protein
MYFVFSFHSGIQLFSINLFSIIIFSIVTCVIKTAIQYNTKHVRSTFFDQHIFHQFFFF